MSGINNNYNFTSNSPEIQKRMQSQENFSALNKETLNKVTQDTAEFAKNTTDDFKNENFIFRIMRSFGSKNPKKTLKSIGLTIATVIGFAFVGNMLAKPTAKLGNKIDDILLNGDNFLSKGYRAVADFFSTKKANIANKMANSKSKTIQDIYDTFKNKKLGPINVWAKTYPSGGRGIFAMTSPDQLETGLREASGLNTLEKHLKGILKPTEGFFKNRKAKEATSNIISLFCKSGADETRKALKALDNVNLSDGEIDEIIGKLTGAKDNITGTLSKLLEKNTADSVFNQIFVKGNYDNISISREISRGLKGVNFDDKDELLKFLTEDLAGPRAIEKLKSQGVNIPDETVEAFKSLTNIDMNRGDLAHSWWPVNILDKAFGKIAKAFGKEWHGFARGNLGNGLMKFNAMDGTLAKTLPGKLVQKSVIFPAEYISNFVNDKSGFGVFLCANLFGLYNTVQDAPKGKKVPTVANDFVGTIGSVAFSMPFAAAITYGIATLKNLKLNPLTFIPKTIGSVVGLGLKSEAGKTIASGGGMARFAGGALRLGLIMFVLMPKISKVVNGAIAKVLGKPYNPDEEKQKQELEKQQNTVIPELGITQKQLTEKIQANPEAMQKLQNDPELQQKIANNPKMLVDFLDNKPVGENSVNKAQNNNSTVKPANNPFMSPANRKILEQKGLNNNSMEFFNNKKNKKTNTESSQDMATYIPSSEFKASKSSLDEEQLAEINRISQNADKVLKQAEKYL